MTRKHFEGLAKVVQSLYIKDYDHDAAGERIDEPLVRRSQVIEALADFCAGENDNFDYTRFRSACLKGSK